MTVFDFSVAASLLEVFGDGHNTGKQTDARVPGLRISRFESREGEIQLESPNKLSLLLLCFARLQARSNTTQLK
jgi:hypothetical protein